MTEIRPYTDKHGELSPPIYRKEASPHKFGQVDPALLFLFFECIYNVRVKIS